MKIRECGFSVRILLAISRVALPPKDWLWHTGVRADDILFQCFFVFFFAVLREVYMSFCCCNAGLMPVVCLFD